MGILLFIYAYRVWSGNAYYEIQGVPQDENVCLYYLKVWLLYASLCVHLFFPLVFALSSYVLIFFKLQENVFMLLPPENREDGMGFILSRADRHNYDVGLPDRCYREIGVGPVQ